MTIAIDPAEIESRRRERTWRLAVIELPLVRVIGSLLLSAAVYINNRYLVEGVTMDAWLRTTIVVAVYAAVSWLAVVLFLRADPPRDLTLPTLIGDIVIWTFAIHQSGAEESWLFFIPLLRVADQTQTTFRRALGFALFSAASFAAMLAWVRFGDHRAIDMAAASAKLMFILFSGIYISLAARTAEARRERLTEAIRVSRDLIRRLEEAHARAEEASAAKSEFVANMSHEMRTPLQGVLGMLQLVIEDERSEVRARRLQMARRSAEMLLSLIDDVLDFSRIEARKLELQPSDFALRPMLADTMKSLGVIAASKKLTLSYFVHPAVPENVHGDPLRLRQILYNLVGNAVKFTREGEVSVQVTAREDSIRFAVCDTGIGVAPSLRQRIFQPFMQADTSHARRHGGTGLGLAIVVRLLEAMRGKVDVTSRAEGGSVFSFRVPFAGSGGAQRRPWELALAERHVAVIEPTPMARDALAETLRARGMAVSAFASIDEVPDDSFACAVTFDARVRIRPQVVIISPFDEHLHPIEVTRPVSERELLDAVGAALGFAAPPIERREESPARAARSLRVLLVEDNEVNREVLAEMLRRLGHSVAMANDGESALTQLLEGAFDVVFMDVQLPGIDGLEVTRRFQASGGTTPIIALTAHTARESRDRCLAAGMKDVLNKPVDAMQLASALQPWSGGNDALLEMVGGNPALLDRVRDAFVRQTPALLAAVRDALARGDAPSLAREIHTLKGSLSHFTMSRGAEIARDVEVAVKAGDLPHAAELMPLLEDAIAQLEEMLGNARASA